MRRRSNGEGSYRIDKKKKLYEYYERYIDNEGVVKRKHIRAKSRDELDKKVECWKKQLEEGTLLVVNVYPDEDLQAWLDYLPNYPEEWVCGCDPDQVLNSDTRYWLRAIPSLYLLDEQKRVVLKDAPLEKLLFYCK